MNVNPNKNLVKEAESKKKAGKHNNEKFFQQAFTVIKTLSVIVGFLIVVALLFHYLIHFDFIKISIEKTENILFNIISLIIGIILAPIIEKSFK
jgi:hypothetical protein